MNKVIVKTLFLVVFGFISACAPSAGDGTGGVAVEVIRGGRSPDFTLESITGESVSLEDYRGKFVLLNFWATWCGPCRVEMPALQNRFDAYDGELVILAIDNDEPIEKVTDFVEELGLTFTVLLDPGASTQDLFLIRGYPTSIFVDTNGIIQIIHIGIMTEGQLDDYLAELGLGEPN